MNASPAPRQNNQVARPDATKAEQTVQDLVRGSWDAIAGSLPASMDSKRFARLVFNSVRKTPTLATATTASMLGALLTASALGLEVGLNNEAHLVPYKRRDKRSGREWVEAQLIVGYGGLVKLFQQHPMARGVNTNWVGEHDTFDYEYGTDSRLVHKPALGERGRPIAFWASYELANGVRDFLILSPSQVARLRGKGENEKRDIEDPEHWMERKTVLKQVLKLAPKSTAAQWAMVVDEQPGGDLQKVHPAISTGEITDVPAAELPPVDDPDDAGDDVVDLATGEVLDPVVDAGEAATNGASTTPEPSVPAASAPAQPVRKATLSAILRELERCGVEARTADAYLPALGVPVERLADLSQDDAVELLQACRGMNRDGLAKLVADAAGGAE